MSRIWGAFVRFGAADDFPAAFWDFPFLAAGFLPAAQHRSYLGAEAGVKEGATGLESH